MTTSEAYKKKYNMRQAISKSGVPHGNKNHLIVRTFGCLQCQFASTEFCPHKIKVGNHHSNWICKFRQDYLKEQLNKCKGSEIKVVQQEELFKLKMLSDKFVSDFGETGELADEFKHISKLIVSLSDKMRRQNEGIKFSGEVLHEHKEFKELVEAEAKRIEERNKRTRSAEFREEVRSS